MSDGRATPDRVRDNYYLRQWYDWGKWDAENGYPPSKNAGIGSAMAKAYKHGYAVGKATRS